MTHIASTYIKSSVSEFTKENLDQAYSDVGGIFGVGDVDYQMVEPTDLTKAGEVDENSPGVKVGLIMAGFSQNAFDQGIDPENLELLIETYALDYSDGVFDNLNGEEDIETGIAFDSENGMQDFGQYMSSFAQSNRNNSSAKNSV